jgi:hypothetical protein
MAIGPTLDKRLNLVLEVERDDKSIVYVHSIPISRQMWKTHYTFISMAINSMYTDGFPPATCARVCYHRMLELAEQNRDRFGDLGRTLFAEMWRLTNVLVPTDQGYEDIPFYNLIKGDKELDADNVEEIQNFICFFMAASWVHGLNKKEREAFQLLMTKGFGVQITALPLTEFKNSIPTSKSEENTGESETVLYIPA